MQFLKLPEVVDNWFAIMSTVLHNVFRIILKKTVFIYIYINYTRVANSPPIHQSKKEKSHSISGWNQAFILGNCFFGQCLRFPEC